MTKWLGGIAAAALLATSTSALGADLGSGGCCADLEERVAELEAVATKKGNRKVRLTVSGYVSHSVMYWDDGAKNNVYIGDGGMNSSRFRFTGEAAISPDVTAGFTYEFGIHENALGKMNQGTGGDDLGDDVLLRDSTVWIKHKNLGRVKIGHGSTATDNLIFTDVSNAGVAASSDVALWNGGFALRDKTSGALLGRTWGDILNGGVSFDTARRSHVSYQSPTLAGFFVEAAVAEDNFWDAALKYAGEYSGFRLAAAAGYSVDTETPMTVYSRTTETRTMMGAASLQHVPSGIFVTGSAALREVDRESSATVKRGAEDALMWHVIAGIERNWSGIGATTLYGEFHQADDMIGGSRDVYTGATPPALVSTRQRSSQANVIGAGVVQRIDSAAMDVFLSYKLYSGDYSVTSTSGRTTTTTRTDLEDFSTFIGGVRIQF